MRLKNTVAYSIMIGGRPYYPTPMGWWQRLLCLHESPFVVQYERRSYGPRRAGDSGRRVGHVCTRCTTRIGIEVQL